MNNELTDLTLKAIEAYHLDICRWKNLELESECMGC